MTDRIRIPIAELRKAPDTGYRVIDVVFIEMLDALEAAHEARQLVVDAFMATPVRDETRDAHFALELARQKLNRATNRFDFGDA